MIEAFPISCQKVMECLERTKEGEILVLSSRFVSREFGELVRWDEVSREAMGLSEVLGIEPSYAEALLRRGEVGKAFEILYKNDSEPLTRCFRSVYGVKARSDGTVGGIHRVQGGYLVLKDPDAVARTLAENRRIGVVIEATEVCDVGIFARAIGCYGIREREGLSFDYTPKELVPLLPDALASLASIYMGEHEEGRPAVIVRGLEDYVYEGPCIRPAVREVKYSKLLWKIKSITSVLKLLADPR